MAKRKRQFNVFNLSFLDCMSCGFGAVVLVFLIINHSTEQNTKNINQELLSEVSRIETEVLEGEAYLVEIKNSIKRLDDEEAVTQGLADRIRSRLDEIKVEMASLDAETLAQREHINRLKTDLQTQEIENERLKGGADEKIDQGQNIRAFIGEGNRQYLTGMQMGGDRILIMLDASSSMLDDTIVNIIRRRNMPTEQKLASRKWQRAIKTVDWLTAQIPPTSQFQIYTFNTTAQPLLAGTDRRWLDAGDGADLNKAIDQLRKIEPEKGTSLHAAVQVIKNISPRPDNVYLIVDGLPTQGETIKQGGTITGRQRERLFSRAVNELPGNVPINVIMFPMEGDPMAASEYWQLAMATRGSYLSPSADWP